MTPNYMDYLLLSPNKSTITNIIENQAVHSLHKALGHMNRNDMEDLLFSQNKSNSTCIIDNQLVPSLTNNEEDVEFKTFLINQFLKGYMGDTKRALNYVPIKLIHIMQQNYSLYKQTLLSKELISFCIFSLSFLKEKIQKDKEGIRVSYKL